MTEIDGKEVYMQRCKICFYLELKYFKKEHWECPICKFKKDNEELTRYGIDKMPNCS